MTSQDQTLIIPDVHGRAFWRDAVRNHPEDRVIFLGDYLDPYPDEGISFKEALDGLQEIIALKKEAPDRVTLLWGNHDMHYLYPRMMGSRYDNKNAPVIGGLFADNRSLFQIADERRTLDGRRFLFTHAGVCRAWVEHHFAPRCLDLFGAKALNSILSWPEPEMVGLLSLVSLFRGGTSRLGSPIWADVEEHFFESNRLPGFVQVFGHSQVPAPVSIQDRAFCLDCGRGFLLDGEGRIIDLADGNQIKL
ncbi:MAG: metallophosphoesterase [Bacteroidales bacterium]|nr:metallophosphoesterase [Bacteroidales bacterium]